MVPIIMHSLPFLNVLNVSVAPAKVSSTTANYLCWNIDASANRGFFWRDLSPTRPYGAKLARQASALAAGQAAGWSLLRFGGSGNDYLTYAFGSTECPQPESEHKRCLNETQWRSLLGFAEAAEARIIFGISMNTGEDMRRMAGDPFPYPWDPCNAREILRWTISQGFDHLLYGVELGNEQNSRYTPAQQVHNFGVLHELLVELWPDVAKRPYVFGPDAHSLHGVTAPWDRSILAWLGDWVSGMRSAGTPYHGVTHHEYVEVQPTLAGFRNASTLRLTEQIATAVVSTVRAADSDVLIFGGEIGPHNGGNPPCNHSSMRWAPFGDSFWYADSLAAKALAGYAGFCRQDLIGADYGLLDCSSGEPLPDFFTALVWTRTMGVHVLAASAVSTGAVAESVRAYAHCTAASESSTATPGAVTVLLINPSNASLAVHFEASLGGAARAYVLEPSADAASSLTGQGGVLGTGATLNGVLLRVGADGTVPSLRPAELGGVSDVLVPSSAVAFYIFPDAKHSDCSARYSFS